MLTLSVNEPLVEGMTWKGIKFTADSSDEIVFSNLCTVELHQKLRLYRSCSGRNVSCKNN